MKAPLIWNIQGVRIGSTLAAEVQDGSFTVSGYGMKGDTLFVWSATPLVGGWYVQLQRWSGPRYGEVQGSSFNLALEVAAAANRLVA